MASYLVTGGCGFIGTHLCRALRARGDAVRVLDNLASGRRENLPPGAVLQVGDVADPAALAAATRGVDGIFHLAGIASVALCNEHWREGHLTNQTGSVTVFEAARAAGRVPVVYASSAAVYGDAGGGAIAETRAPAPMTAYGADKFGSELHGRIAQTVHGVPTTGLRFFNVYGPGQDPSSAYSGVISIFRDRIGRAEPVTVFGDGLQSRDFVFVGDVVRAILAAMDRTPAAPAILNVCTGRSTTLLDLIAVLARLLGTEPQVRHAAPRPGDIRHSLGDPGLARRELGIAATVPLDEGLAQLLA